MNLLQIFLPFRRATHQILQSLLRLFRFENCETSAAPMQVGAVLRAEKIVRSAPRLRNFSARKCANSLQILCTADAQRTKTSAGVAAKTFRCCKISAPSCWRVRCRKRAHPAIGHAQNFAKICIDDARICCKFFTISTRDAPNFAVPSEIIPI